MCDFATCQNQNLPAKAKTTREIRAAVAPVVLEQARIYRNWCLKKWKAWGTGTYLNLRLVWSLHMLLKNFYPTEIVWKWKIVDTTGRQYSIIWVWLNRHLVYQSHGNCPLFLFFDSLLLRYLFFSYWFRHNFLPVYNKLHNCFPQETSSIRFWKPLWNCFFTAVCLSGKTDIVFVMAFTTNTIIVWKLKLYTIKNYLQVKIEKI